MNNNQKAHVPAGLLLNPAHLISLGFGSGLAPKFPGTAGTALAAVLFIQVPPIEWKLYLGIITVAFVLGIFLCAYTARALSVHDHPAIVWDEIVGFWISMFMVPRAWYWVLTGFIVFRVFDIVKPWPISLADKHVNGGLGIMLDDLIAGLFTLLLIQIILYLL